MILEKWKSFHNFHYFYVIFLRWFSWFVKMKIILWLSLVLYLFHRMIFKKPRLFHYFDCFYILFLPWLWYLGFINFVTFSSFSRFFCGNTSWKSLVYGLSLAQSLHISFLLFLKRNSKCKDREDVVPHIFW